MKQAITALSTALPIPHPAVHGFASRVLLAPLTALLAADADSLAWPEPKATITRELTEFCEAGLGGVEGYGAKGAEERYIDFL